MRYEKLRTIRWICDPKERAIMFGQLALAAPRLIVHLASVVALTSAVSCVPVTRYEEAVSASEVELAGRKRAEATIVELRQKLASAEAELSTRERKLAESEHAMTESKLESSLVAKERDEQSAIVDQLRSELARAGDHLRYYSDQKRELEASLSKTDTQAVSQIARVMRDLSLEYAPRIQSGAVSLDMEEKKIALRLSRAKSSGAAKPTADELSALLSPVAKIMQTHGDVKLEIGLPEIDGKSDFDALKAWLADQGIAEERVQKVSSANTGEARPETTGTVELFFTSN